MKWGNGETPESAGMKSDHLIGKYYVLFDQQYKREIQELIAGGMKQEVAEKQAPLIQEAQEILRGWEKKDEKIISLWHQMNNWAYKGFKQTYDNLGVDFDAIQYESETYLHGKAIVMEGLRNNLLEQKPDGSIWADLREDGLDEKLLLRGDGTSVYMTQDLGTAVLRHEEFHPSEMIYVVGNEQNYHFDVLKKILEKTGHHWSGKIYHLSYGMVELPEGKMKSREGTVVDADDLMQEMILTAETTTRELGKVDDFTEEEARNLFRILGLGALKYFILKVDPKKNMLFDPKESIDFNGNTGPFIQYTHARIRSLLRKAELAGYKIDSGMLVKKMDLQLLPQEREIIKCLHQFPATVEQAGRAFDPSGIANYTYDLVKEYNQFYQEIPVLKEENRDLVMIRLIISAFAGEVIRKAMNLLGIDVPDRM
jgi:arginyl-tRNA synthetase